jgi:hypothetical protein
MLMMWKFVDVCVVVVECGEKCREMLRWMRYDGFCWRLILIYHNVCQNTGVAGVHSGQKCFMWRVFLTHKCHSIPCARLHGGTLHITAIGVALLQLASSRSGLYLKGLAAGRVISSQKHIKNLPHVEIYAKASPFAIQASTYHMRQ